MLQLDTTPTPAQSNISSSGVPKDENSEAIILAARHNRHEVARALLTYYGNAEFLKRSVALHIASSLGHTDMARLLMDSSISIEAIDANGAAPLILVCNAGRSFPEVVQVLLERGAEVAACVWSPRAIS